MLQPAVRDRVYEFSLCYYAFDFDIVGFLFFLLSQVQCGEIEVEKKIDETIEHFISWIEKHPNKKSQVFSFPFTLYQYTSILVVLTQGLNVLAAYRLVFFYVLV